MEPIISVIIPVYNVRPYLCEALDSVLGQTYQNLEILIIDDGSNDGSEAICDEYCKKDSRINVIHQETQGLSAARNTGLDRMTGEIVSFLDPDDALHPKMFETMLKVMDSEQADIVICGFSQHKTQGEMRLRDSSKEMVNIEAVEVIDRTEALQRVYSGRIDTAVWNKIYKKSIWDELRFPEGHLYEGTYLSFDIFDRADRIAVINQELIMHRNRPGSIMNSCTLKMVQDREVVYNHYENFIQEHYPEVFSEEQLYRAKKERIRSMLAGYYRFVYCHPHDKKSARIIQGMLKKTVNDVHLKGCCLPIQLSYYTVMKIPVFDRFVFPIYKLLRKKRK